MEVAKFKDGSLGVVEIIAQNEYEGSDYNRIVKVYDFDKLKTFNYEQVSKTSLNRCLKETIEIMSPNLPYEVLEEWNISFTPIEKYLITISRGL